jgi:hypothetical protein
LLVRGRHAARSVRWVLVIRLRHAVVFPVMARGPNSLEERQIRSVGRSA